MTKEQLIARRDELGKLIEEQHRIQIQARQQADASRDQINALGGAKQDCEFWLAQVMLAEQAAKETTRPEILEMPQVKEG
jgi:hypothetical protein